jgi:sodium/potassium-transporting ATPase subunit alpha
VRIVFSGFSLLLLLGALLCFLAYGVQRATGSNPPLDNVVLGTVLVVVVGFSAIFAFLQERKSSDVMRRFSELVPHN